MRVILGIVIGFVLTIGGVYVADISSSTAAKPMVNWEVVGQHLGGIPNLAREGWKKIVG